MTETKTKPLYSDSDVQELVLSLDLAQSELLLALQQFAPRSGDGDPKVQIQQLRAAVDKVMTGLSENVSYYSDEPHALTAVRYALRERGYEAQYPLMRNEPAYGVTVTVEELAMIEPDLKRLRDQEVEFKVEVTATTEHIPGSVSPLMEVTVRRNTPEESARQLLSTLTAGDDWNDEHDAALKLLGGDPDNYRATPEGHPRAENWPAEQRGKVTFDTGQAILDHLDKAQN